MRKFIASILLSLALMAGNTYGQLNVLLVNDNGYAPDRIEIIKTSLDNLGYGYTFFDCPTEGSSPSLAIMQAHSLVIWYTGNDGAGLYFWNGNETVNQNIADYIDGGGMFWVQGLDFIYDVYGSAPDSFAEGDFMFDYLGIAEYVGQSHLDDGVFADGVPQLDAVSGNGIYTFTPVEWTFSTMWYVDALFPAPGADSIYRMGPTGYDFDDYFSAVYHEKGDGKVLSFTFETARLNSQTSTDTLISQGLQYFEQFASSVIYVTDITVSGEGGATTITQNQGSLQLMANVQPANATTQDVFWSVIDGTSTASIDQSGLLQATGTTFGNGTVWVKAAALDGSGVSDSLKITISNQGSEFEILLVDDNGNDTDRYKELDSTLSNLNQAYDIYHTLETGTFPDLITLSFYDVVIWYTGNDGVDLKLWDISNPDDYKFNEPLVQYLDVGGVVWLQGLDFFYDVLGSSPDTLQPGQFIYDYMGVKVYAAQTYADDGGVGVAQMDIEAGNPDPICTFSPIEWVYSTMWYADALEPAPNATGVYRMGPPGYILDTYLGGIYNVNDEAKILTFSFETARIDTEEHTDIIFGQVLDYFEDITAGDILVENINVSGEGGATGISVNNGTLQMLAEVEPEEATNQTVFWSITNGSGSATIDQNGLLQASGFSSTNGTLWVKATATDGSGVSDSIQVLITNQGADFEILLVNDNDFGTDRYLEIDTTLNNLNYTWAFFNTVIEGTYPDYDMLNGFDVVIWYTGNDGAELKLWDVSNPDDFMFNEPLVAYLDNGGIVWLQGLDFMYDMYGSTPVEFTEGQFVYDYMGIETYAAQSLVDDGGGGLPQLDLVPGNPLCTLDPMLWVYTTMYYADGFVPTAAADPVYQMGPEGYALDSLFTGIYHKHNQSNIFTLAIETARLESRQSTDTLFYQVLESFKDIGNTMTYSVNLNVFLEGPYEGSAMNTDLNADGLLPLVQPFNTEPWNYSGNESVDAIPDENIVDWVLIEIRDAVDAQSATAETVVAQQAAFLLNDGSIVGMDGNAKPEITSIKNEKLFVVIYHRNHLPVLSSSHLVGFGNILNYNFTTALGKAYGTIPMVELDDGKFGMYAGDVNSDFEINVDDVSESWEYDAGKAGYLNGDVNMDNQANNKDKNLLWYKNNGKLSQLPQ